MRLIPKGPNQRKSHVHKWLLHYNNLTTVLNIAVSNDEIKSDKEPFYFQV